MSIKPSELANELRKLADRVDAAELQEQHKVYVSLTVHGVDTREALSQWAAFMGEPKLMQLNGDSNAIRVYGWHKGNPIDITVFYKAGLLGGAVRQVADDNETGLAALMAEMQPMEAIA